MKTSKAWLTALGNAQAGVTNLQVMNEFTHVVFRRMPHLDEEAVYAMADGISGWGSAGISLETIASASKIRRSNHYPWWDCLLLASALELGCKFFLSEDMHDGHDIDGLTIINPFMRAPSEILARY
ncbi:PIN domain-containing protein [Mesorhizobium sp. RMAD-H1]|uniref:PIN domain-containing protein n=1 Tax=Mesorhizobium sp. RMAD-H1 TaxID=2587065 RepID=UPI001619D5EE|nr:PIN domain-containing protein [Mesorhizobium sp. RMAD-H1]MBB2971236.1 putative nucleic acid-binding protein [Mesorhizobium sp. RMAD-H1]